MVVRTLLTFTEIGTHDIESKSRDAKGVCNDVHIVIHGQLSLEERRIFVVDVPTLIIQRTLIVVTELKMMETHLLEMIVLSQRASCMRSKIRISTAGLAISAIVTKSSPTNRTEPPSFFWPPSCWEGYICKVI